MFAGTIPGTVVIPGEVVSNKLSTGITHIPNSENVTFR
jgi:hypothetical protein